MWKIIESYFLNHDATTLQVDSYNTFIRENIHSIIKDQYIHMPINKSQSVVIQFENVHISRPYIYDDNRNKQALYPYEARNRDLSYETAVVCDVRVVILDNKTSIVSSSQTHSKIELFKLPVMVNSCICNLKNTTSMENEEIYNNGGYFIIKGKERVIVAQERINYNCVYVYKQKTKYKCIAEIRSIKESADYSVLLQAKIQNDDRLVFAIPYIGQDIPIAVVFKAMGVSAEFVQGNIDRNHILFKWMQSSFQPYSRMSTEDCVAYISDYTANKVDDARKTRYTMHILENEIVPHLGLSMCKETKAAFLVKMLMKLVETEAGLRAEDDRDHICNKRIEMVGDLLSNLINALFRRSVKSMQQFIEKREDTSKLEDLNILNVLNRCKITQRLYYCFTTGNWGLPKSNYIRQGVSQILSRLSYLGMLSHLNRIIVPIGKESRNTDVRQTHAPDFGLICPVETPEGQSVGIVKNFSILTKVSTNVFTVNVIDIIDQLFADIPRLFKINDNYYCVFVNGVWIASVQAKHCPVFIRRFKYFKSTSIIAENVSISIDRKDCEINIYTDNGRIMRPVLNVANIGRLESLMETCLPQNLWTKLVEENVVVYIDGNEAESSVIAMYASDIDIKYEYCEIHPAVMLGICANTVPFSEHSQAPRNVYISAMMKQAIGMYALSHNVRFDTVANVLDYPQKKLVQTKISQILHCEDMPSGQTVTVAIMCYTGQNQEDSIIFNKSAVDRDLFNSTSYKTTSCSENKKGTHESEVVGIPDAKIRHSVYDYSKLDRFGIVRKGAKVVRNDVLVGKTAFNNDVAVADCSLVCKASEEGVVDAILETTNASGYKHIKIKLRQHRIPEIGDKFASTEAQKSICGAMYNHEDMPFTGEGIVPDIILNPHAIPSRMTINMLLEILSGKVGCLNGTIQDASVFDHDGEKLTAELGDELVKHGYNRMGTEIMYNGFTGVPFKARIFIGPAYYQRLKHLVSSKMHARGYGDVQVTSRQPIAGRARDGGLRYGEINFWSQWCAKALLVYVFIYARQHIQIAGTCAKNL